LKNTKAVAVLIEVCFIDNKKDMARWNADKITSAIATALTGKIDPPLIDPVAELKAKVQLIQIFCNGAGIRDEYNKTLIVDGLIGTNTRYCILKLIEYLNKLQTNTSRG
jgi:hypothetical protein